MTQPGSLRPSSARRRHLGGIFLLVLVGLVSSRSALGDPPRRGLIVFAASSLREAFDELASAFEQANPACQVRLNYGGSQELRWQIEQGADADLFASADFKQMNLLESGGLVNRSARFAGNEPVLVVPADNPAGIHRFEDLPRARRLVIGAPEVPIGNYTLQILDRAAAKLGANFRRRVLDRVVSRELNVRQTLAKVTLGEADAAVVYRSDALAASSPLEVIVIPPPYGVRSDYFIAIRKKSAASALAQAFVTLVRSPAGQRILAEHGFSVLAK